MQRVMFLFFFFFLAFYILFLPEYSFFSSSYSSIDKFPLLLLILLNVDVYCGTTDWILNVIVAPECTASRSEQGPWEGSLHLCLLWWQTAFGTQLFSSAIGSRFFPRNESILQQSSRMQRVCHSQPTVLLFDCNYKKTRSVSYQTKCWNAINPTAHLFKYSYFFCEALWRVG